VKKKPNGVYDWQSDDVTMLAAFVMMLNGGDVRRRGDDWYRG